MKKEIENWWKHAQKDLEKAEVLYNSKHFDGAAFFCQQGVEKGLKALLIKTTASFPRTHDLTMLARLTKAPDNIITMCARINPAYTAARYPDSPLEYTREDCEKLRADSKVILKWIEEKLG